MCGKAIHFDEWICLVSGPVKYSVAQGAYCSDSDGFYVACSDHSNSFFDIAGKWTQNGVNRLYKVFGAPEGENHIWQWKEVGFEPVESEEYISRIKNKIH
jgi:hypothetical protein